MSDKQGESENRTYRGCNERWKTREESEVREGVSKSMGVEVSTAPTVRLMVGHVLDKLRTLPDASVQMCCTSPPYWGLRDYSRCACAIGTVKQDEAGNRTYDGFNERWALANGKDRQHMKEFGERDGS